MKFDERGRELPDPTPLEVPLNWKRPPSMQELIKQHIRSEMSRQAADTGMETFEEADDFDVDEDPDPLSQYELREMAEERPKPRVEAPQEKPAEPAKPDVSTSISTPPAE